MEKQNCSSFTLLWVYRCFDIEVYHKKVEYKHFFHIYTSWHVT